MPQMRLHAHTPELPIMPQMPQIIWVLFKVSFELLALNEFLTKFARACSADGDRCDGAEGIVRAVAEGVYLLHVERVRFDFFAFFGLMADDFGEDLFVVLGTGDARWFVFPVIGAWYDEGEGHTGLAGTGCAADAVGVGFRGGGEVEVEDAGDVFEIDPTRYAVFFTFGLGCFAFFWDWVLGGFFRWWFDAALSY